MPGEARAQVAPAKPGGEESDGKQLVGEGAKRAVSGNDVDAASEAGVSRCRARE
ncbi:hypothetical protein ACL7TT_19840 [Microbulbifer sp. 2304DJ12-6]|uniref:hypothetical protein n=1 Tax=Microbulbifer sp. 2304DJ12-6 TaxID=3233340 RepID=UPI0039AFE336